MAIRRAASARSSRCILLRAIEVVPADAIVEELWHPAAPPTAKASLQNHVSRLRRLIGERVVETVPPG